jgi:hypothetical protein
MEATEPDRSADEDGGSTILATLSRIANEARDRDREALAAATARGMQVARGRAATAKLPRVA